MNNLFDFQESRGGTAPNALRNISNRSGKKESYGIPFGSRVHQPATVRAKTRGGAATDLGQLNAALRLNKMDALQNDDEVLSNDDAYQLDNLGSLTAENLEQNKQNEYEIKSSFRAIASRNLGKHTVSSSNQFRSSLIKGVKQQEPLAPPSNISKGPKSPKATAKSSIPLDSSAKQSFSSATRQGLQSTSNTLKSLASSMMSVTFNSTPNNSSSSSTTNNISTSQSEDNSIITNKRSKINNSIINNTNEFDNLNNLNNNNNTNNRIHIKKNFLPSPLTLSSNGTPLTPNDSNENLSAISGVGSGMGGGGTNPLIISIINNNPSIQNNSTNINMDLSLLSPDYSQDFYDSDDWNDDSALKNNSAIASISDPTSTSMSQVRPKSRKAHGVAMTVDSDSLACSSPTIARPPRNYDFKATVGSPYDVKNNHSNNDDNDNNVIYDNTYNEESNIPDNESLPTAFKRNSSFNGFGNSNSNNNNNNINHNNNINNNNLDNLNIVNDHSSILSLMRSPDERPPSRQRTAFPVHLADLELHPSIAFGELSPPAHSQQYHLQFARFQKQSPPKPQVSTQTSSVKGTITSSSSSTNQMEPSFSDIKPFDDRSSVTYYSNNNNTSNNSNNNSYSSNNSNYKNPTLSNLPSDILLKETSQNTLRQGREGTVGVGLGMMPQSNLHIITNLDNNSNLRDNNDGSSRPPSRQKVAAQHLDGCDEDEVEDELENSLGVDSILSVSYSRPNSSRSKRRAQPSGAYLRNEMIENTRPSTAKKSPFRPLTTTTTSTSSNSNNISLLGTSGLSGLNSGRIAISSSAPAKVLSSSDCSSMEDMTRPPQIYDPKADGFTDLGAIPNLSPFKVEVQY